MRLSELEPAEIQRETPPATPAASPPLRISELSARGDRPLRLSEIQPSEIERDESTALGRGFRRAIPTTLSSLESGAAAASRLVGANETAEALERSAAERTARMERESPRRVPSLSDVRSVGDVASWAGETLAENMGIIGTTVAGGALGAAARAIPMVGRAISTAGAARTGAFVPYAGTATGDVYETIRRENPDMDPRRAAAWGALGGVLSGAVGIAGLESVLRGATARAANDATRSILRRIAGGAGRGAVTEAPTEVIEEAIQAATTDIAAGRPIDFTSNERLMRFAEAGAGGMVVGAPFGAAAGALPQRRETPSPQPSPSPLEAVTTDRPAAPQPAGPVPAGGESSPPPAVPAETTGVFTPPPAAAPAAVDPETERRRRVNDIYAAIEAADGEITPEQEAELAQIQAPAVEPSPAEPAPVAQQAGAAAPTAPPELSLETAPPAPSQPPATTVPGAPSLTREEIRAAEAQQAVDLAREAAAAQRAAAPEITPADVLQAAQRRGIVTDGNPAWQRLVDDAAGDNQSALDAVNRLGPSGVAEMNAAAAAPATSVPVREVKASRAVVPNRTDALPVRYALVEMDSLIPSNLDNLSENPAYPQRLQPRDRDNRRTEQQIVDMVGRIERTPEFLGENPEGGSGTPIIQPNGVILSGNGRALAMRRAQQANPAAWGAYQQFLRSQGYPVDGMTAPVLVRINDAEMTEDDLAQLARDLNAAPQQRMTTTEQALGDSHALTPDLLALYRGGDVMSAANRDFRNGFLSRLPRNEVDGIGDADIRRRLEAAMFAAAYGEADFVRSVFEDEDSEINGIGNALRDVAAAWAVMRAEVAAGSVHPDADMTAEVVGAARFIRDARRRGQSVPDALAQMDAFNTLSEAERDALDVLMNSDAGRPAARDVIAGRLLWYAQQAMTVPVAVDMFGASPEARIQEIINAAKERGRAAKAGQASIFDRPRNPEAPPQPSGPRDDAGGSAAARPADDQPGAPVRPAQPAGVDGEPAGPAPSDQIERARWYTRFIPDGPVKQSIQRGLTNWLKRGDDMPASYRTSRQKGYQEGLRRLLEDAVAQGRGWGGGALVTREGDTYTARGSFGTFRAEFPPGDHARLTYHPDPAVPLGERDERPSAAAVDIGPFIDQRANLDRFSSGRPVADTAGPWTVAQGGARVEYLVAIGRDGETLAAGTNEAPRNVLPPETVIRAQYNPTQRVVIHHNHPTSRALSQGDHVQLAYPGMHAVYAHAADGQWYRAQRAPRLDAIFARLLGGAPLAALRVRADVINRVHVDAFEAMARIVIQTPRMTPQEAIAKLQASRTASELLMIALDRAGLISYSTNRPMNAAALPEPLRYLLDAATDAANATMRRFEGAAGIEETADADGRRAGPVRVAGDVGELPAGLAEPGSDRPGGAGGDLAGGADDQAAPGESYWRSYPAEPGNAPVPLFQLADDRGRPPPDAGLIAAAIRQDGRDTTPVLKADNRLKYLWAQIWKPQQYLAATVRGYAPIFQNVLRRIQVRNRVIESMGEDARAYFDADRPTQQMADKALDWGTRHSTDWATLPLEQRPREIVNDLGGPFEPGGMSTMERGERLVMTPQAWAAYDAIRKGHDRGWAMTRAAWLTRRSLPTETMPADLRRQAAAAQVRAEMERDAAEAVFMREHERADQAPEARASLRRGARKAGMDASRASRADARRLDQDANALEAWDSMRRTGYASLTRTGDYYLDVKGKDRETGKEITVFRAHLPTRGLNRPGRAKRFEAIRQQLLENFPREGGYRVADQPRPVEERAVFDFGDVNPVEMAEAAVEGGFPDADAASFIDAVFRRLSDQGFRLHLRRRRDVPGYDADFGRSYSRYAVQLAGYIARIETARDLDAALAAVKGDPIVHRLGKRLNEYTNEESQEWAAWRAFMFFTSIATNLTSMLHNMTQTPFFAGPMIQMYAGSRRSARELMRASRDAMSMLRARATHDPLAFDPTKAPADVIQEVAWAQREGILSPTATIEMMAQAYSTSPVTQRLSSRWQRALTFAASLYRVTEEWNKTTTFIAAVRAARDPQALRRATEVYSGSKVARPLLQQADQLRAQREALPQTDPRYTPLLNREQALRQRAARQGNARFRWLQARHLRLQAADLQQRAAAAAGGDATLTAQAQQLLNDATSIEEGHHPALDYPTISPALLAQFVTEETQLIPGKAANPQMMRGPGRGVFQFKQFMISMLTLQWQWASRYGEEGRRAFALNMIAIVAVAGVMGLPFADDLKELFRALTGTDFEQATQQIISEHWLEATGATGDDETGDFLAEAVRRGMTRGLLNIDVTDRLGFGRVLPVRPIIEMMSGERINPNSVIGDLLGVSASWITRGLSAYNLAEMGFNQKALEFVAALFGGALASNAMRAYNMATEGTRTQQGRVLLPPERLTAADVALRAAGWQSANVSRAGEADRWSQQAVLDTRSMLSRFTQQKAYALVRGSEADVARIDQEIADYNRTHEQQIVISPQAMRRAIRREQEGIGARPFPRRAREEVERIQRSLPGT